MQKQKMQRAYINLKYGDYIKHLRMDVNAMCDIEDILGCAITDIGETMGMREMRVVLFCSLRWEDKNLTLQQTGEIMQEVIQEKGVEYLGEILGEVMNHAFGNKKDTQDKEQEDNEDNGGK